MLLRRKLICSVSLGLRSLGRLGSDQGWLSWYKPPRRVGYIPTV